MKILLETRFEYLIIMKKFEVQRRSRYASKNESGLMQIYIALFSRLRILLNKIW
jgi:hypothetical protein